MFNILKNKFEARTVKYPRNKYLPETLRMELK